MQCVYAQAAKPRDVAKYSDTLWWIDGCGDQLFVKAEKVLTQADYFSVKQIMSPFFLHNQTVYKYCVLIRYDLFFFREA